MGMDDLLVWNGSWAWGLPLILLNVIFHAIGLGLVLAKGVGILSIVKNDCRFLYVFALVMGVTAILATLLHASEACIWAGAFRVLGVFSDGPSAWWVQRDIQWRRHDRRVNRWQDVTSRLAVGGFGPNCIGGDHPRSPRPALPG
jgi:hypothetical protein